jgi:hypothetical protein
MLFESLGSTSKAVGSLSSDNLRVDLQLESSSFFPEKYQSMANLLFGEADLSSISYVFYARNLQLQHKLAISFGA